MVKNVVTRSTSHYKETRKDGLDGYFHVGKEVYVAGMPAEEKILAQITDSSTLAIRYTRQIDMQRDTFCQWLRRRRVVDLKFPITVDSESWQELCAEAFGNHEHSLRHALMHDIVGATKEGISFQTFEQLRACGKGTAAPATSHTGEPCNRLQNLCQSMAAKLDESSAEQPASLKNDHDPNQMQAEAYAETMTADIDQSSAGQPALLTQAQHKRNRSSLFSMSDSSVQQLINELKAWHAEHDRLPLNSKYATEYEKKLAVKLKNLKVRTRLTSSQMQDFMIGVPWVVDQDLEKQINRPENPELAREQRAKKRKRYSDDGQTDHARQRAAKKTFPSTSHRPEKRLHAKKDMAAQLVSLRICVRTKSKTLIDDASFSLEATWASVLAEWAHWFKVSPQDFFLVNDATEEILGMQDKLSIAPCFIVRVQNKQGVSLPQKWIWNRPIRSKFLHKSTRPNVGRSCGSADKPA